MATTVKGLVVAFNQDISEESAQKIVEAIKLFEGVGNVDFVERNFDDFIIQSRVRNELAGKMWDVLFPKS